jgi:ATP-dependent RNA helicase TDRD9
MEQYVPMMGDSRKASEHVLKGPFNPLEMKIYGKVKSLLGKAIRVEEDSVNAVLLDDQPGDAHERVLVAASVSFLCLNSIFISCVFIML